MAYIIWRRHVRSRHFLRHPLPIAFPVAVLELVDCLNDRSREISKPWDIELELSDRTEFWQVIR